VHDHEQQSPDGQHARVDRPAEQPAGPAAPVPLARLAPAGNGALTRLLRSPVLRGGSASQGAGPLDPEIATAIEAERGGGSPLAEPVRGEMEQHFGVDLGAVRLHTGPTAAALNRSVQAEAFTTGTDVFLSGGLDAASSSGRELLAHELTHVVQQATGAAGDAATVSHPDEPAEVQARAVGQAVAAGPVQRHEAPGATLDAVEPVGAGGVHRSALPAARPASGVGLVARAPAGAAAAQQSANQAQQSANQAQQTADQASAAAANAQATADQAKQTGDDALAQANKALDATQLAELRGAARFHIGLAFTEYVSACKDVRDSIKAAAKQDAELMAMVLDIAMGFAAPGLGRAISGWATRLPQSTTLAYRTAMATLTNDNVKAMFTGLTKVAGQELKMHSTQLAGETNVDAFISTLETVTHTAFQKVGDDLGGQDAAHVGVVAAMFDSRVANKDVYRAEIKRLTDMFERQVDPIGEKSAFDQSTNSPPFAVWVRATGGNRLALVEYQPGFFGSSWGSHYWLLQWISPEMQQLALAKQTAGGRKVETIDKGDLSEFK
jgi:hypothetical protein